MDNIINFGQRLILLLDDGDIGDAGDVMTREGVGGAAFKPPSGGGAATWGNITGTLANQTDLQAALDAAGGNPFDQDLNTDDDVVFGSVETAQLKIGTGPYATTGNIRGGATFEFIARNAADDDDIPILTLNGADALSVGNNLFTSAYLRGTEAGIQASTAEGQVFVAVYSGGIDLFSAGGLPISFITTGDLNINGTPGVTDAAVVVDGVTLSFTKGLLIGVA